MWNQPTRPSVGQRHNRVYLARDFASPPPDHKQLDADPRSETIPGAQPIMRELGTARQSHSPPIGRHSRFDAGRLVAAIPHYVSAPLMFVEL